MGNARADLPMLSAENWRGLRWEWLWVYRAAADSQGRWTNGNEAPCGVFFVEKGSVEIEMAGRVFRVDRGHAFFSAPGLRRHRFHPGARLLSVGFRCHRPDGLSVYAKGLPLVAPASRLRPLRAATVRLFAAVHGDVREVGYRRAVEPRPRALDVWAAHEAAFLSWFATYVRALAGFGVRPETGHQGGRRLDAILRLLGDAPFGSRVDFAALAARAGCSRRRLDQLLRAGLGLTARGFLERRRLEAARRLLGDFSLHLKEVATRLGFRQPSHFTAWFRAAAGSSPSAYRLEMLQP